MWFLALVATVVLIWSGWWVRRPHHHHSGGGRSRDGHFAGQHDIATGYRRETPAPREHAAPGEYDGD
jgi:hypothetical protein